MKVFDSANRIYDKYEALLLEVYPEISRLLLEKELTSIIIYTINSLNNQTLPPLEIWKLLFRKKQTKDLQNVLLIAELCLCTPFSNASIKGFFSQMKIGKIDCRNKLNGKNLSSLLYIKTQGPTLKEFHDHYCSSTMNLWLNNQRKQKKYKKRKDAKKYQKLDFTLPSVFDVDIEISSSECETNDEE